MPRSRAPEPVAHLTWGQVLRFRLRRGLLEPRTTKRPVQVTRRLCGVQAQVASAASFAIAARRRHPRSGEVHRALAARRLVKTWAMRGTLHLLPADEADEYLAAQSTIQPWRTAAWQRDRGVTAAEIERLIDVLREVLSDEPIDRSTLIAAVNARMRSPGVRARLGSGWGELLKPAANAGVLLQGPPEGNAVTFVRADAWIDGWRTIDPHDAGVALVRRYLGTYGPAAPETFSAWCSRGRATVRPWFEALATELSPVEVEGRPAWALTTDLRSLVRAEPSDAVRLLGPFDAYVLGPGTAAAAVVPPERRSEVSRTAGWISRVILLGGRVVGTWEHDADGSIRTAPWGSIPATALEAEVERVRALPSIA